MNAYTNDKDKLCKPTANSGIYKQAKTFYKHNYFRDLYKAFMINILLDTFAKEFANATGMYSLKDNNKIDNDFIVRHVIRMRSLEYLTDTYYIFSWFNENYKRVDVKSQTSLNYITLKNLYNHITTDYYRILSQVVK